LRESKVERLLRKAIIVPAVVLIGMYIAGALIDGWLKTTNTFSVILAVAGGVPAIGFYFKKLLENESSGD
jgi:hypothetical protein